mgnify:CR=1 FL=1
MSLPSEVLAPSLALPLTCRAAIDLAIPGHWLIYDANGRKIAVLGPEADAEQRATEMVRAANAQPALAELQSALRDCIICLQYVDRVHPKLTGLAERLDRLAAAKRALALVEGDNG